MSSGKYGWAELVCVGWKVGMCRVESRYVSGGK